MKTASKNYCIGTPRIYLFPFSDWEWDRKCHPSDISIFSAISESESGKQGHSSQCLSLTSLASGFTVQVSNEALLHSIINITFCNIINCVLLSQKEIGSNCWKRCNTNY